MRVNVRRVWDAWREHRHAGRGSISTDGEVICSYRTPIVWRDKSGSVTVNILRYSKTTTTQQNSLLAALAAAGIEPTVVWSTPDWHRCGFGMTSRPPRP